MVDVMVLGGSIQYLYTYMEMTGTHIDPPADTETANKISNKDSQETIPDPIMGDAHVTQIMGSKHQLMPSETEEHGTGHQPVMGVRQGG